MGCKDNGLDMGTAIKSKFALDFRFFFEKRKPDSFIEIYSVERAYIDVVLSKKLSKTPISSNDVSLCPCTFRHFEERFACRKSANCALLRLMDPSAFSNGLKRNQLEMRPQLHEFDNF